MDQAGFELTIPASERPQTHTSDRAATGKDLNSPKMKNSYCSEHIIRESLSGLGAFVTSKPRIKSVGRYVKDIRNFSLTPVSFLITGY